MSDHHINKRNRERAVRRTTLDKRERKAQESKPLRGQGGGRRRWQPSFTPSGVPAKPPER